jgi:hypothetical protein
MLVSVSSATVTAMYQDPAGNGVGLANQLAVARA